MTIHDTKSKFVLSTILVVAGLCLGAQMVFAVVLSSDTAVYLSGSNITLTLAAGSNLTSYSVDTTTLTLNLASGSSVTVKSNNLYTLTNSLSQPTLCSASPAYSYVTFTAGSTETVTVTPSTTVACSGTAPVIGTFGASPSAITAGQSSTLSWSLSGASTVSIDNGVGAQSTATTSSVSVSPAQTTTYTLTAVNYIGTTTAQTTVTVTPASYGGGGGGGGTVSLPTIDFFSASPATVQPGQSSLLSWSIIGAATVSIGPSVALASLSPNSGIATVTPATTTTYTLSAANDYNQSVTATATVTVSATTISPAPTPLPPVPAQPATSTPSSGPAYCLVNHSGTFFLILNGVRHGIANPGLLYSYGYGFGDAVADAATYQALQSGNLLGPSDGALVKFPNDPTVYLISGLSKHGFTSASVFSALGYRFSSVLTIPAPQLEALPLGNIVSSATASHLPGTNISSQGTVYFITSQGRQPYPSLTVYNSWNLHNNFSRVVPANASDLNLPIGSAVTPRTSCGQ
jgi:hypothetical protein